MEKSDSGKIYMLSKMPDGIYLRVETVPGILFPVTLDRIYTDLTQRRIPYEATQIHSCYFAADGNFIKIAPVLKDMDFNTMLQLKVTPDHLKAYLLVLPFLNGGLLSVYDLQKYLQEQNIIFGVKTNLFNDIIAQQGEYREWLIAEGLASENGEDARLIFHFNPEGIAAKPQELEDGSVDFYNLNLIQTVQAGTVLVEKIPAKSGTNGKNVYGNELKCIPGKDIRLPIGTNTQPVEGNRKLVAASQGHVVFSNNRVNVFSSYQVKGDVDFNTGNIRFPGNVIVNGDVKNNFVVEATGDVEIHGNLEGMVQAGNNLQVKKGIVRGKAIAKGSIFARYIENGTVESDVNINVTDAIMHSNVKAGKRIVVSGKKGLIVGGTSCAGEEISARNIGSAMGTLTTLEIGIAPEAREEYKEICRKLPGLLEIQSKNDKIIKALTESKEKTGILPGNKNEMLQKIRRYQYQILQAIDILNAKKAELEIKFENMGKARVNVENNLYTGVTIYMGKAVFNVVEEMRDVLFTLDGVEIKYGPRGGKGGIK